MVSEEKITKKLTKKLGREPTADEVAKKMKKMLKKAAKKAEAASPAKTEKKRKAEEAHPSKDTKKPKTDADASDGVGVSGRWSTPISSLCEAKGWPGPTPIQAQCWPILCDDRDVVAVAETGSGKTLGFGMPALSKFKQALAGRGKRQPAMLVLAPTRELANQSFEVLQEFCGKVGATAAVAYGGVPRHEQKREIAKCAALVATPGRLNDFIQEGSVDLSKVSFFCLDEADRMLDMGFVQEVKKIAAACANPEKLTAMFSATWPTEVQNIASEFLKPDFVRVNVGAAGGRGQANKRIDQSVIVTEERSRDGRLLEILKQRYQSGTSASYATARLIVFGLYKKECARLETFLNSKKWKCVAIHGDMSQAARNQAFEDFKSGAVPLLVATDVAARGLDIPNVELVVNFSFPLTIEDYVHRIGRTGRAGKTGTAITLFHGEGHERPAPARCMAGCTCPGPRRSAPR
ncbi:helicase [Aureococcus anophagefferens]|nr:helicase [Aureococcus anophagefferens]